jgi:FkbM family methyltransferase
MISWAQNLEDVMLARALGNVERGFYVDVGAYDPCIDSVTRHFYDRGWNGINVDPVPAQIARVAAARPRDVNLGVALADRKGRAALYDFSPYGLSTLDAAVAASIRERGFRCREIEVEVTTLAEVFARHAPPVVDFLKIDVEGSEALVLRGADFARHRPRVVVVESTAPMREDPTFAAWESALLACGYLFAWFDGLNRFYLRREDAGLMRHFRAPPNVFDDYVRACDMRRGADDVARQQFFARVRRAPAALATRLRRRLRMPAEPR